MKLKVRKGDKVIVLAGKEAGNIGFIKEILMRKEFEKDGSLKKIVKDRKRVIVEGLNKVICFNKEKKTGMSTKEASIHISNVAHVDPLDNKAVKVAIIKENDKKKLISKRSRTVIREI